MDAFALIIDCSLSFLDFKPGREARDFLLPEHEIVIDTEVIPKSKEKEKSEKERMQDYEKLASEGKAGTMGKFVTLNAQVALENLAYQCIIS